MNDDAILLRRFADEGSEAAFTALVQRYLDLVYGAALRRCGGDAHRAAEVAQQVFTSLARQARSLAGHPVLGAWLHAATRNVALTLMMSEQRRRVREQTAVALETASATEGGPRWDEIRPVLDAAIDELSEPDRVAVVLRFLEGRPFAEIGTALHLSADAARMRTDRALEKLRTALARRGITSTAAALGAVVSTGAACSAPTGLVASLVPAALQAAAVGAGTSALATFLMSTKGILTLAGAAGALGCSYYLAFAQPASAPPASAPVASDSADAMAALRRENLALKAEVERLRAAQVATATPSRETAPAAVRSAVAVTSAPSQPVSPLPAVERLQQQRAMLNNLRQIRAAIDQFNLEYKRPPASLDELVGETKYIRRLVSVAGESYAGIDLQGGPITVTTPTGISVTYDPKGGGTTNLSEASRQANREIREALTQRFGAEYVERMTRAAQKAGMAYQAKYGKTPPKVEAALPYFDTPQEAADFLEFSAVAAALGMKL